MQTVSARPRVSLQAQAYLLRKLSSEKAFDRRLILDLPLSTFQDVGDAAGDDDT
jgi:hypothetical protein